MCINIGLTHESISTENEIINVIKDDKGIKIVDLLGNCWLGATARKYENITNIPPT